MRKFFPFLITALLLGSCTKELQLDFDNVEPKVVVMSCVEPDSLVHLRLTYSRFFLSSQPIEPISDATVLLRVNGQPAGTAVAIGSGNYAVDYRPQAGDRLDLRVQVPGHDAVEASTAVPSPVSVSNPRYTARDSEYGYEYAIHFTLNDPADEDNYYFVRLMAKYHNSWEYRSFSCTDYMLSEGMDVSGILDGDEPGERYGQVLCFSDDNIAGRSYEIELRTDFGGGETFYLEVTSLSRDRYLYELTTDLYDDDPFELLFAEPVQIHCNINGGIGIFAARNRSVFRIDSAQ